MSIKGLGPHGERASPPERVTLLPEDIKMVRDLDLNVCIVMHTMQSDWSKLLVQGLVGTLGDCGVSVTEVADSNFSPERQAAALDRLIAERPKAIISLPVANADVADAHKRVSAAKIPLMLVDNVPTGLLPGKHYASLVSADNFGLGQLAAELLSNKMSKNTPLGVIGYEADFYVTNEREIAFNLWMQANRPNQEVLTRRFKSFSDIPDLVDRFLTEQPELSGLFVVWDTPCEVALETLARRGMEIPTTTVDLGKTVAVNLANGGPIVGIAAQRPFRQGVTVAKALITELLGRRCPDWIALPGVAVSLDTVVQHYQAIWREPMPGGELNSLNKRFKMIRGTS
ncbi:MAG: sugar ABC transporter substrate-binding protein [Acidimicrobiaceae bacterium]|nr:sugar ABC transporter substrate-binding protein [Acidimicrobiaceae bacterium]